MVKYLLLFCLISLLVTLGKCIQCHQCTTLVDNACLDPYDQDNIDDCGDKDTHCVKYKTVVELRDSGYIRGSARESVVVTRSCEPAAGKSSGCYGTVANGGVVVKCRCSSDGCNGSYKLSLSLTIILSSLFFSCSKYFLH